MRTAILLLLVSLCPVSGAVSFPGDYLESRTRFKESCERLTKNIKGKCEVFQVRSAKDQDLTIDYGVFTKPDSKKLLVVVSGNHGPEAYSGATAQEILMQSYMPAMEKAGIDVVLIHALNPYGFKYEKRTDEDNVNLNRNFVNDSTLFHSENRYYEKFRSLFEPEGPVTGKWAVRLQLLWSLILSGFDSKPIAIGLSAGQYNHEKGVSFGGTEYQPQVQFIEKLLRPLFPQYKEILFLDFHTGLGEKNKLHIMTGEQISATSKERAHKIFNFNPKKDEIEFTSGQDKGFYSTTGDLIDFIPKLTKEDANVMPLILEFGTVGKNITAQLDSAALLILDNQARFNQCSSTEACENLHKEFMELFNPSGEEWRGQFIGKTHQLYSAIISGF